MSAELNEPAMMTLRIELAQPIATDIYMFELRHLKSNLHIEV